MGRCFALVLWLPQVLGSTVTVAVPAEEDVFEAMAAVLSGFALAKITKRRLIVDTPRLEPLFNLTAFHSAFHSNKCKRRGVIDDMSAEEFFRADLKQMPSSVCVRGNFFWAVVCRQEAVGQFPSDTRLALAEVEKVLQPRFEVPSQECSAGADVRDAAGDDATESWKALEGHVATYRPPSVIVAGADQKLINLVGRWFADASKGRTSVTALPTTSDEELLKANYALSNCEDIVYPCNTTFAPLQKKPESSSKKHFPERCDTDLFLAFATARAAMKFKWSSLQCPLLAVPTKCPAWPQDPVDIELKRSLDVEASVLGTERHLGPNWNPARPNASSTLVPAPKLDRVDSFGGPSKISLTYLRNVLWQPKETVLIYNEKIYVDEAFLKKSKAQRHIIFLLSIIRRYRRRGKGEVLPNGVYVLEGGSKGQKGGGFFPPPAKRNATTWGEFENVGGGLLRPKRRTTSSVLTRAPSFSIAKIKGWTQSSVLIPNMYFGEDGDLDRWHKELDDIFAAAERQKNRIPRVLWRGAILSYGKCARDVGNYARLAAASLTRAAPETFDIKCVVSREHPRDEAPVPSVCNVSFPADVARNVTSWPCQSERPYDSDMVAALKAPGSFRGDYVPRVDFSKFQFVLNLPGSTSGSYSRNLNHLWALGSVVVLWNETNVNDKVAEWYYPALRDGITHIAIDKRNAKNRIANLKKNPGRIARLQTEARHVHDKYLSPDGIARYLTRALQLLRSTFDLGIIDEPLRFEREFRIAAECRALSLIEFSHQRGPSCLRDLPVLPQLLDFRAVRSSCNDIFRPYHSSAEWELAHPGDSTPPGLQPKIFALDI